jgi:hypothetical protein
VCTAEPSAPPLTPEATRAAPAAASPGPAAGVEATASTPAPKRVHLALVGGLLAGEVLGAEAALQLFIDALKVTLAERMEGTLGVLVQPLLFGGAQSTPQGTYSTFGGGTSAAVGWQQRLGPVELMPHLGATLGLEYQWVNATSQWQLNFILRGLAGLRFNVPAGDRTHFIAGLQVGFGGPSPLWLIHAGVAF